MKESGTAINIGGCDEEEGKYSLSVISVAILRPAPLLKNAQLSDSKVRELYLQIIQYMRRMYQDARLVHADLSEFNMLYVFNL